MAPDYPIHIDTISRDVCMLYFKGLLVKIAKNGVFFSLKIVFTFANSTVPDEICIISSGSLLFAKVYVYLYPV